MILILVLSSTVAMSMLYDYLIEAYLGRTDGMTFKLCIWSITSSISRSLNYDLGFSAGFIALGGLSALR